MKRFGQLHLMHPFKGARILRDQLHEQGIMIGSKHVKTLMTRMGIKAVDCKPNTSNKTNAARWAWTDEVTSSSSSQIRSALSTAYDYSAQVIALILDYFECYNHERSLPAWINKSLIRPIPTCCYLCYFKNDHSILFRCWRNGFCKLINQWLILSLRDTEKCCTIYRCCRCSKRAMTEKLTILKILNLEVQII